MFGSSNRAQTNGVSHDIVSRRGRAFSRVSVSFVTYFSIRILSITNVTALPLTSYFLPKPSPRATPLRLRPFRSPLRVVHRCRRSSSSRYCKLEIMAGKGT